MALTVLSATSRRRLLMVGERGARLTRLWRDDLFALVSAERRERWSRRLGLRGPLVISVDGAGAYWEAGGAESPLPDDGRREQTLTRLLALRIDDAQILKRRLDLPTAAVARLDAALDMNLSTWTPFSADEAYAAAHVAENGRRPTGSLTDVELRCVPRRLVDERIAALHAQGLDPDAIELGEQRFILPRATRKRRSMRRRRWLIAGLSLLLLGQGIGLYAVMAGRQRDDIEALQTMRTDLLTALRHRADAEKQALIRREGFQKIAARMEDGGSVSRALRVLVAVLPKDAVVREFELGRDRGEGHVTILGAAGLDVVSILATTGFYRVRDLSVLPSNDADRKVYSTSVVVAPWEQPRGRATR